MIINIVCASQYQAHRGGAEVPTKNESNVRAIKVPSFVIELLRQYHIWWNKQRTVRIGKVKNSAFLFRMMVN